MCFITFKHDRKQSEDKVSHITFLFLLKNFLVTSYRNSVMYKHFEHHVKFPLKTPNIV